MASVASIMKSRIVNGNAVASIDGQYIRAAKIPAAAPALANVVGIDPATGELAYQPAGGGPAPGLYLPLAGGTMDAFPAGVINAHTLNEVINITGSSTGPGNDTIIQTINGNDLSFQTDPNESITANTGQFEIDANIRCEINATTIIQPVGGYTYPNNPENGLTIQNWVNPTGNPTTGLAITNTNSSGNANGIVITSTKSDAFARGISMDAIDATAGDVMGIEMISVNGNNTAYGEYLNSINAQNGDATGIYMNSVSSANAGAKGIELLNVSAPTSTAIGITADSINGLGGAYGVNATGVVSSDGANGGANAYGFFAGSIQGDSETTGFLGQKILGQGTGPVYGMRLTDVRSINTLGGNPDVVGVNVDTIRDENGVGNSWGVLIRKVDNPSASSQSFGVFASDIANKGVEAFSATSISGKDYAYGVSITSMNGDITECVGVNLNGLTSGSGKTYGVRASAITSSADVAYGIDIDNIDGNQRAYGIHIGPNISSGGVKVGFNQEGVAGVKVYNVFDGDTAVGGVEDVNTGRSFKVNGSEFQTAQLISPNPTTSPGPEIINNGGSVVLIKDTTGGFLQLPNTNVKEGLRLTIIHQSVGGPFTISVNAGGGTLVNGAPLITLTPTSNYDIYTAVYTNVDGGVGQWYIG